MSLAAEQAPKSNSTSSSAPPANMPAVLNREPSQQDLEIARQLQSFQSQAIPSHETPRTDANAQQTPKSMSEILSDSKPQPQPEDHSRNSQQPSPSPYPPVAQFTPLQQPQPQQRTPQSSSVSGGGNGQICSNCGTTKTPLWRRSPTGAVICNACGLYYKARNQMRPVGLKRGAAASSYSSDNNAQERGTSPKAIQGGATYVAADQTNDGTCPGGGRCNGTGGHDGCSGCPAYNNRISKTAQVALRQTSHDPNLQTQGEYSAQGQAGGAQQSVMIACQNCGTTITPLWRRDELGNTICNACGLYHKLHGHHRPVQMKKAEIKRRKRVVPNNMVNDDQSSVYTAETAEDERRSIPPQTDAPSPAFSNQTESKVPVRLAGGPIPVDFTDTFRAQRLTPNNTNNNNNNSGNNESSRPSPPNNPRKRSFSAAAGQEGESGPYAHAQNMVSPGTTSNDNIDPSLPARNREFSAEPSRQAGGNATNTTTTSSSSSDKDARRAALEAESEKMLLMLKENRRKLEALQNEE